MSIVQLDAIVTIINIAFLIIIHNYHMLLAVDGNIEDALRWLHVASEPWNMVVEKWNSTFNARILSIQHPPTSEAKRAKKGIRVNEESIHSYVTTFKALQQPQGWTLVRYINKIMI